VLRKSTHQRRPVGKRRVYQIVHSRQRRTRRKQLYSSSIATPSQGRVGKQKTTPERERDGGRARSPEINSSMLLLVALHPVSTAAPRASNSSALLSCTVAPPQGYASDNLIRQPGSRRHCLRPFCTKYRYVYFALHLPGTQPTLDAVL